MTETLEQLIQQLRSPDATQRRQAIMALANLRDPAALQPLAHIYRNDPETELRELALKAGRYIRQAADAAQANAGANPHTGAAGATAGTTTGTSAGTGTGAPPRSGLRSDRDIEIAKSYLDAATNFLLSDDKGRAIENLGKALALNPELANEGFTQNMMMTLTGMAPAQAVPLLSHPDRREQLIMQVGGKKALSSTEIHHGMVVENVTWTRVLTDLGVYWLVNAVGMIVLFVFALSEIEDQLAYSSTPMTLDLGTFLAASLVSLVMFGVIFSLFAVFILVIWLLVLHYTATLFFQGNAGIEVMMRRMVPLITMYSAFSIIANIVVLLVGSSPELVNMIQIITSIAGILYLFYLVLVVGQVYNFGFFGGCVSILMASVAFIMFFCGCLFFTF